ncbi:reverse transcriptase [Phytophthora megakarya]|uniref:Reverse transcriptase n=1 Tax=Phytophthora megakarya TaxID=4795 RepID=A0A225V0Q7_9STRA|nr:reverse transcriptase [Phytophthora megakarya]
MIGSQAICLISLSRSTRSWDNVNGLLWHIDPKQWIAERMVQTTTSALKMYVEDLDQRDWDEYAERLTFAINTARDRIRGETSFYMIHGWDPRSTLEAVIPVGSTRKHARDPRRWRYWMQKYYQQAREQVNQRLREAIADRADTHNDLARPHPVESGSRVWLYLDRVREGYVKNLSHLWHGPFRVAEKIGEYAVRTGKRTRYGRIYRGFLVHWRGYGDPPWIDEADLNCGALLYEFLRDRANRNRFGVMQSHEEP